MSEMACPVHPSSFAALVPVDINDPSCSELRSIMALWTCLVAEQQACKYKENRSFTDTYKDMICNLSCS